MASNRFDTSVNQQYVNQYVPLPFDTIAAVGEKINKEYDDTQKEVDAFGNIINKINVVNEVMSEGDANDPGIKNRSTGYGDLKNQVLNKYTIASKEMADGLVNGTLDLQKFKQKKAELEADLSQDIQKLRIAEANSAVISEMDKKYRENKDAQSSPHILNNLAEAGANLLKNPYTSEYKGAPIGEVYNLEKDGVNERASHYQDQIISSGAVRRDGFGNIVRTNKYGVIKDRIFDEVARGFEADTKLYGHYNDITIRGLKDRGVDLNTKEGKEEYIKEMNQHKGNFIQAVIDKAEKNVLHETVSKDIIGAENRAHAYAEQKVAEQHAFASTAIQGEQGSIWNNDKQALQVVADGLVDVNTKTGVVKTNWSNLGQSIVYSITDYNTGKFYQNITKNQSDAIEKANEVRMGALNWSRRSSSKYKTTPITTNSPDINKINQLNEFATKCAKAVGYNDQEIKDLKLGNYKDHSWHNKIDEVMTAYNVLSKVKFGGVQLDYNLAQIETRRAEQSPTSYQIYDETKKTAEDLNINPGEKLTIGERVFKDNKPYLKGTITTPGINGDAGTSRTVMLSAKNEDQKSYFGKLGNSEKQLTELYTSGGEVNPKNLVIRDDINSKGQPLQKDGKTPIDMYTIDENGNKVKDNLRVFASDYLTIGAGGTVSYTLIKSDNNLTRQKYILHLPDKNGRSQSISLDDYSQFITTANDIYYIYGEGRHEINAAKSKEILNRLESITVEDEN